MVTIRSAKTFLLLVCLCLLPTGVPPPVYGDTGHPTVVNLSAAGPRPKVVRVAPGTEVHWVSHLAPTKLVVVTMAFLEGQRVAQATTAVEGYNSFVREGDHFVGRLEGSGGKVALRFNTPGEYAYTMNHHAYLTGTIVVHP